MRVLKAGGSGLDGMASALQALVDTQQLLLATTMPTYDEDGVELTPGVFPGGGATVVSQDWTYDGNAQALYTDAVVAANLLAVPGTYRGFVARDSGSNVVLAVTFDRPIVIPSGKSVATLYYRPWLQQFNNPAPTLLDFTAATVVLSPT